MAQFIVSARKYRPQRFKDVLGQEHISHTLKMAFSQDKLAHAFLFTGPRGVGKTTCARILAKALNCTGRQVIMSHVANANHAFHLTTTPPSRSLS